MAHLKDILIDAGNIIEYVLEIHREKEENLLHAYCAAVTIQKYFRGYLVRRHMKMLHTKTTIIQKHWRGFLGRELYYKILKETVEERCKQKFNNCATKIQKVWRGYLTRKFIFNYSLFKKWVDSVKKANEHIIEEIERERKLVEDSTTLNLEEEAEGLLQCILLKNHHLLRTYHRKGVLSRKEDTKEYSFTEELLKSFKFIPYMKKQKKGIAKKETFEQNEEDLNVEFTLEKIKKLQRDYAVEKCKERRKIKQVNQKKSGEVIEKKKIQISTKDELMVLPMYGSLSNNDQLKVFKRTSKNCRKVVVATNIAETSITIPGIVYV